MINWTLLIGAIGAITGVVSLTWHIINSRSKVVLDKVSFIRERGHDRSEREFIHVLINIKNRGNRSTTIEDMNVEIGKRIIPSITYILHHIEGNSSRKIDFYLDFTPKEFNEFFKEKKVRLGVTIIHTFGILKKYGYTDFSTDYLNL